MTIGKWLWHGGVISVSLVKLDRTSSPNFVIVKKITTDFRSNGALLFHYREQERPRDDFSSSFLEHNTEATPLQLRAALVHLFSSTDVKMEIE